MIYTLRIFEWVDYPYLKCEKYNHCTFLSTTLSKNYFHLFYHGSGLLFHRNNGICHCVVVYIRSKN